MEQRVYFCKGQSSTQTKEQDHRWELWWWGRILALEFCPVMHIAAVWQTDSTTNKVLQCNRHQGKEAFLPACISITLTALTVNSQHSLVKLSWTTRYKLFWITSIPNSWFLQKCWLAFEAFCGLALPERTPSGLFYPWSGCRTQGSSTVRWPE